MEGGGVHLYTSSATSKYTLIPSIFFIHNSTVHFYT
jgi:hypothetical protein